MLSCDTDEWIVCYVFMTNTSLVYIHLSWLFHSARRDIRVRMIQKHKSHLMFPKYQALCDPIKTSSNVLLNSVTRALLKPDDLLLSTRNKLHSFLNWISMKPFLKYLEARRRLTYKTTKLLLFFPRNEIVSRGNQHCKYYWSQKNWIVAIYCMIHNQ